MHATSEFGQRLLVTIWFYCVSGRCHLCGELWYHTRAEGFTYVSFTHTHILITMSGQLILAPHKLEMPVVASPNPNITCAFSPPLYILQ
jgi:hypothetical protein